MTRGSVWGATNAAIVLLLESAFEDEWEDENDSASTAGNLEVIREIGINGDRSLTSSARVIHLPCASMNTAAFVSALLKDSLPLLDALSRVLRAEPDFDLVLAASTPDEALAFHGWETL